MRDAPDNPEAATAGTLLLVRHGQSTYNAARRWAGHADPPLTEAGVAQAQAAAATMVGVELAAVASSPQQRARATAALLAENLGLPLLDPIELLRERHVGDWCGLTNEQIERRWPGRLEGYYSGSDLEIPGSPPWQEFLERVLVGLRHAAALHPGPLLVVAHGGVLRAVYEHAGTDRGEGFANLSGCWLSVSPDTLRVDARFAP